MIDGVVVAENIQVPTHNNCMVLDAALNVTTVRAGERVPVTNNNYFPEYTTVGTK